MTDTEMKGVSSATGTQGAASASSGQLDGAKPAPVANPSRYIVTHFWSKPIPPRDFDWSASFSDDEPNDDGQMTMGYGATEQAAIDDLLAQVDQGDDEPANEYVRDNGQFGVGA
jgi:hypothetical protein